MSDENQDIFGKIDAMLGKRAGFGGAPARLDDEFPLLTEVVKETAAPASERAGPVADAMAMPVAPPEPEVPTPASHLDEVDIDRLAAALEARLSELLIRQQLRIEALVRRVVREELERRG